MSLLKYVIFSFIEYFTSFIFILIQFRFSLKENISQILLISLLLSFVSYSFMSADLSGIFPLIQLIIVLLYMQNAMKVSIFNALIMFLVGYIVLGVVQTCIIAISMHLGFIDGELKPGMNSGYVVQFISSGMMLLFTYLTYVMNGGFSFIVARSRFSKKQFIGKNRLFIVFIVLAFIITIFSSIVILEYKNPPFLFIASVLLVILLMLFYLSLKRDEVHD